MTAPTRVQLSREQQALEDCRSIGDYALESEFCRWIMRHAGRYPGTTIPVSAPTPQPAASKSPSCGCPEGDRTIRELARKVINEQLGKPTPGCWKCDEVGRQCYTCEAVARQNRYPGN